MSLARTNDHAKAALTPGDTPGTAAQDPQTAQASARQVKRQDQEKLIFTERVTRLHHMHRPDPVMADLAAVDLVPVERTGLSMVNRTSVDTGAVVVRKPTAR